MAELALRAGALPHPITVEVLTEMRQSGGTTEPEWVPDAVDERAFVRPREAREFFEADQLQADVTHVVKMRYYAGLTSKNHRLIFKGRTLYILGVVNIDEANHTHELRCKEDV